MQTLYTPRDNPIQIASVNVGSAEPLALGESTVLSGIFKRPVPGPCRVGRLGLAADEQVDRRVHGGPDKALNIYPQQHYAYWSERLQTLLEPGAFGENLTTLGLLETEVCLGDIYRMGQALVQVTQPRQPCGKLAARHNEPQLVRWVYQTRFTGFYVRCLESGTLGAGDPISLQQRSPLAVTVAEATAIMLDKRDRAGVERLLAIDALSEAWREELAQRPA